MKIRLKEISPKAFFFCQEDSGPVHTSHYAAVPNAIQTKDKEAIISLSIVSIAFDTAEIRRMNRASLTHYTTPQSLRQEHLFCSQKEMQKARKKMHKRYNSQLLNETNTLTSYQSGDFWKLQLKM